VSRLPVKQLIERAKRFCGLATRISHPERLRVYLGRDGLAVCLVTGRFRPVVRNKSILPSITADCDEPHNVSASLNALTIWLDAHPRCRAIEWVIGIGYVRYLLLPWDERLSSETFCHSLAAALFAQQSAGIEVQFSANRVCFASLSFGRPLLAALIPNEVISEIAAFASRHQCRTRSITPALSLVWDLYLPRIKNDTGTLTLVEGTRLLRVNYDHGHVTSLSVRPFSGERTGVIAGEVTLAFPARHMTAEASAEFAQQGLAPDEDPSFAYALCGVL
jgi:hypothetical protein